MAAASEDGGVNEDDLCTCGYDGPDEFGNYDLMVSPDCPLHAASSEKESEAE